LHGWVNEGADGELMPLNHAPSILLIPWMSSLGISLIFQAM